MLNYPPEEQICNQCVLDNQENSPATIENCYPDHDSRCRSSVLRPQTGPRRSLDLLLTNTWPSLAPRHLYDTMDGCVHSKFWRSHRIIM
ncbi:hypothetical protein TNCV_716071 [Trichonephila clavipes]|nr:hypothetical protein TNCV_716071 [Trichonephila clavipes]